MLFCRSASYFVVFLGLFIVKNVHFQGVLSTWSSFYALNIVQSIFNFIWTTYWKKSSSSVHPYLQKWVTIFFLVRQYQRNIFSTEKLCWLKSREKILSILPLTEEYHYWRTLSKYFQRSWRKDCQMQLRWCNHNINMVLHAIGQSVMPQGLL